MPRRPLVRKRGTPGGHDFVCDFDGITYHSDKKRITWDGHVVCDECYEARYSIDFYRVRREREFLQPPIRQEAPDCFIEDALLAAWVLVDEEGTPIITDEDEQIQIPTNPVVLD
jgi:hypothetical protein